MVVTRSGQMPEEQWRAGGAVGVIAGAWLLGFLLVGGVSMAGPESAVGPSGAFSRLLVQAAAAALGVCALFGVSLVCCLLLSLGGEPEAVAAGVRWAAVSLCSCGSVGSFRVVGAWGLASPAGAFRFSPSVPVCLASVSGSSPSSTRAMPAGGCCGGLGLAQALLWSCPGRL